MTQDPDRHPARPTKCSSCESAIGDTPVCDYCHTLNPAAAMMDFFTLLGLPMHYEIDVVDLRKKYLALSRHAHPDYHTDDSPEVQTLHLQVSSSLNQAYRTLLDPAARAGYLLELLGGKSTAQDKSVPSGFLETMMMMQEEVQEAVESDNGPQRQRLAAVLQTQHDGLVCRMAELFASYQQAVACRAVTTGLLREIRQQVNAAAYVKKLITQVK